MVGKASVGIDAGKLHHHAVVIDHDGQVRISRRLATDQAAISGLLQEVSGLAEEVTWAVDLLTGPAALLLALLWQAGQQVVYLPGKAVNRAADGYRGEGKTDARDAAVLADQARLRRDLVVLTPTEELLCELGLLVARRRDLVGDRTRALTRLREHLTAACPALERALDVTAKGVLVLLCGYQTPQAIAQAGVDRLTGHLRKRRRAPSRSAGRGGAGSRRPAAGHPARDAGGGRPGRRPVR